MADETLLNFLVQLATSKELRNRFDKDPVGTMRELGLSKGAIDAILESSGPAVRDILNINQQHSDAQRAGTLARGKAKKARPTGGRKPAGKSKKR